MTTTTVRRDKGTGSVAFDKTSGFWVGRLEVGKDLAGRRIRVKVIGASRSEARTKLDDLRRRHESGIDVGARTTTFAELADAWLKRGLPADLSENTVWNYGRILRGHVLPTLGAKRVADLKSDDIDTMLDVMADRGLAASSMRHALNLTRRILRFGMRRDLVVRNVAEPVQTRRGPKAERYGLTVKQAKKLLRVAAADRLAGLTSENVKTKGILSRGVASELLPGGILAPPACTPTMVTIREVAADAAVARSTVSYVRAAAGSRPQSSPRTMSPAPETTGSTGQRRASPAEPRPTAWPPRHGSTGRRHCSSYGQSTPTSDKRRTQPGPTVT